MTKYLLVLTVLMFSFSCNNDASTEIEMSEDELVAIIKDMHIAHATVLRYRTENRDSIAQMLKSEMAKIHNISEERIDFVMEQIQRSPKRYLELEKIAVNDLKALKDSLKTIPMLKTEIDTLARAKQR